MGKSLIEVKLNKPELTGKNVYREGLMTYLDKGKFLKLILVSAMAGAGKSTALSEWLERESKSYVWISLDEWDDEPNQFFYAWAAGMTQIDPVVGQTMAQLLSAQQSMSDYGFAKAFVMCLQSIEVDSYVVLDDFHLISDEVILKAMKLLIEHLPQKIHLVIATREDPDLPIGKLRLEGQLLEVRMRQLQFQEADCELFLNSGFGLDLSHAEIQMMTDRTEGWVAGLQLAGISMMNMVNRSEFVREFSGNHQFIMEYLVEEVLNQQSDDIRAFLLGISILDTFCADLCDVVLGHDAGSSEIYLTYFTQSNLFMISLDETGDWFRLHHLFGELLRRKLKHAYSSETIGIFHVRAGSWFEEQNMRQEAVHHYLKGSDPVKASNLVEKLWAEMDLELRAGAWLSLASQLPESEIHRRPVLAMGYGWALIDTGDVHGAVKWLNLASRLYDQYCHVDKTPLLVADSEQMEMLPATLSSAYGFVAATKGDIDALYKHATNGMNAVSEVRSYKGGVVSMMLVFAKWSEGKLGEAESLLKISMQNVKGHLGNMTYHALYMVLGELYLQMAEIELAENAFHMAIRKIEKENQMPILMPSLYLGLAKAAYVKGNVEKAFALMEKSKSTGNHFAIMDWQYKYYLLLGRLYQLSGKIDLARSCVEESQATYFANPIPDWMTPERFESALINQMRSEKIDVQKLIETFERVMDDAYVMKYLDESEIYVKVKALLMWYDLRVFSHGHDKWPLELGLKTSEKMLRNAERQNRTKGVEDFSVLMIEGLLRLNRSETANQIERVADLALKTGYWLPFLEMSPKMKTFAAEVLAKNSKWRPLLKRLLADKPLSSEGQSLIEPLTVRELEVLELIALGYSNQDICNQLFLALSTVKGYNQNIFGKLGVKRRTEAVAMALKLGIVKPR